jgi:hypothetical protein
MGNGRAGRLFVGQIDDTIFAFPTKTAQSSTPHPAWGKSGSKPQVFPEIRWDLDHEIRNVRSAFTGNPACRHFPAATVIVFPTSRGELTNSAMRQDRWSATEQMKFRHT